MHPVVRILCFLVFAAFVATGGPGRLAVGAVLLLPLCLLLDAARWRQALAMARRLRWLLLSIALVYWVDTPGAPLWPGAPAWLPSAPAVAEAAHRAGVLLSLVLGVVVLLAGLPTHRLVPALASLSRPLAPLGLDPGRLALRLGLTLERVPEVRLAQRLAPPPAPVAGGRLRRGLEALGARAAQLMAEAEARAAAAPEHRVDLRLEPVPPWQWLLPAAVAAAFLAAGRLAGAV